jgi:hypothetical protein
MFSIDAIFSPTAFEQWIWNLTVLTNWDEKVAGAKNVWQVCRVVREPWSRLNV